MLEKLNAALKPLGLKCTAAELYRSKYRQLGWAVTFYDTHEVLSTVRYLVPGSKDPTCSQVFEQLVAFVLRS